MLKAVRHLNGMKTCMQNCSHYLKEGVLTDEFMLKDSKNLEKCLRECNVTLRWLMLHTINTGNFDFFIKAFVMYALSLLNLKCSTFE